MNQPTSATSRLIRAVPPFVAGYFWIILKNAIGWLLILAALVAVPLFPGPLGTVLFFIGFALIWFPGKRRFTSRVLRGRRINTESRGARVTAVVLALVLPPLVVWYFERRRHSLIRPSEIGAWHTLAVYLLSIAGAWLFVRSAVVAANFVLTIAPRLRRRVRPWLRRHGVNLLPPRARRRQHLGAVAGMGEEDIIGGSAITGGEEIIEFDQRQVERARSIGRGARSWVKPLIGTLITVGIFIWMLKPVVKQWGMVHDRLMQTSPTRFALAACMFAAFLFIFRVTSWRYIIQAAGTKLPLAAATRIWSTSELARYLPGVIWQVVGRVYLVRPYGVSGAVCSTSQVLELSIFLVANLVVTLVSLPWFAGHFPHEIRAMLYAASSLAPALLVLLHPRIFYGLLDRIARMLGKQPVALRLNFKQLLGLLTWATIGLIWQGLAIWLLVGQPSALALRFSDLGLIVGAYCLAWCAGFLAFWAPGGLGTRELVLMLTLEFALPPDLKGHRADAAFLAFLAVLLRLWTIMGEIIVASFAYALDYRGALGRPDAPGRLKGYGIAVSRESANTSPSQSFTPAHNGRQQNPKTEPEQMMDVVSDIRL